MADPTLQSPYVQQAIPRLTSVPNLITPMTAGSPHPAALPGQQLPQWNLGSAMKTGMETGQMALKSKQIAAEAAAAAEQAKGKQQWAKMYNDYVKLIQSSGLPADEQQARIALFGAMHGITPDSNADLIRGFLQNWANNPPAGGIIGGLKSLYGPTVVQPRPAPTIPQTPNNNTPVRPAPSSSDTNNGSSGNDQSNTDDKWW